MTPPTRDEGLDWLIVDLRHERKKLTRTLLDEAADAIEQLRRERDEARKETSRVRRVGMDYAEAVKEACRMMGDEKGMLSQMVRDLVQERNAAISAKCIAEGSSGAANEALRIEREEEKPRAYLRGLRDAIEAGCAYCKGGKKVWLERGLWVHGPDGEVDECLAWWIHDLCAQLRGMREEQG